ncbi:MAG TPA: flagellar export chaperone FliS, partial [Steroidobacteraceae bacterium]
VVKGVQVLGDLDIARGAEIAQNLDALYDYMTRRLLQASLKNSVEMLDEVAKLLRDLRDAWTRMPREVPK